MDEVKNGWNGEYIMEPGIMMALNKMLNSKGTEGGERMGQLLIMSFNR